MNSSKFLHTNHNLRWFLHIFSRRFIIPIPFFSVFQYLKIFFNIPILNNHEAPTASKCVPRVDKRSFGGAALTRGSFEEPNRGALSRVSTMSGDDRWGDLLYRIRSIRRCATSRRLPIANSSRARIENPPQLLPSSASSDALEHILAAGYVLEVRPERRCVCYSAPLVRPAPHMLRLQAQTLPCTDCRALHRPAVRTGDLAASEQLQFGTRICSEFELLA